MVFNVWFLQAFSTLFESYRHGKYTNQYQYFPRVLFFNTLPHILSNHCVTVAETIISSGEGICPFPKTMINLRKENWVSRVESPSLSVGFL